MWLHINFIECLCPYISSGFNNIACKSLYFVATWKHTEKASSLAGCLVPSTVICRHQVQGTPMLSNSLCIWQTAHGPQHANAQKSLQAEPCNESKFDFFFSYSFSDEYETMHQYNCECTVLFIFTTSQDCGVPYSHQSLDIVKMCTIIPVRLHVYTKWLHQNLRNWKPKLNNTDFKPLYYLRLFFVTKCKLSISFSIIPNFKNNHQKW